MWDASALEVAATQQGEALMASFSDMWAADMVSYIAKLNEWIPTGWQAKRDCIISDTHVRDALLGNKNVKSVSELSGLVHETNQAIQWLHQEGLGKEKMVPAHVLAASASIVRAAIDTAATSLSPSSWWGMSRAKPT